MDTTLAAENSFYNCYISKGCRRTRAHLLVKEAKRVELNINMVKSARR